MTKELTRIPLHEFLSNGVSFFEHVIQDGQPVIVENADGKRAILKPVRLRKKRIKTKTADFKAFHEAAGSWSDVDVDAFLRENDQSHQITSRAWFAL